MRVSGLVLAAILLVSITLLAQHSSGGGGGSSHGGSSSSGSSHSSFAGGSSVSGHSSGSSPSHAGSTGAASSHSSPASKLSSTKEIVSPEKKSSRSFFHPFKKAKPVESAEFKRPASCLKGRTCPVCPPGGSHFGGACRVASNGCLAGQSWNGFSCGAGYWSNDCNALAEQLAAERQEMQGQNDYGQSLRLRMLQQQYEQCLRRFGYYPFSALLFDTP
jgi:hypothetical protein